MNYCFLSHMNVMVKVRGFLCSVFGSFRILLNGYRLFPYSQTFWVPLLVNHFGQPFVCFWRQFLLLTWGLGLWYNTAEFERFCLQGLNFTFVREEGLVGMGDQWELDAEDQMGDTLCICGKVFANSYIAPLLFVLWPAGSSSHDFGIFQ